MKTVAIVGTVGIPACYGGFESLVENLTLSTNEKLQYIVFCSSVSYKNKLSSHNNARLIYIPLKANGVQSILYDILSLIKCCFIRPNVVMILGVSGCIFLPLFRLFSRSKVITNIDGLEWKRDKWGKWTRRFLKWSEAIAIKYSDVVITDNQAITNYVEEEYSVSSQTIAYGGDHAIRNTVVTPLLDSYALGICRIEPENNIAMILEAFSKSGKRLKFVGNWEASEFGRAIKNRYSIYNNIELLNPIYDLDDLYILRRKCSLYLHGHSAGGTNPSLVEMMHFGIPIMAFDCSFNRYSTDNKATYFKTSNELINLLNISTNDSLSKNAKAMRELAVERYTWNKISVQYEDNYFK
ncbi:DUF1972 domain-containing protein [Vibrio vulnificus]|nr:DUF1972 domain-containing protein [Vibrio vulnificus]